MLPSALLPLLPCHWVCRVGPLRLSALHGVPVCCAQGYRLVNELRTPLVSSQVASLLYIWMTAGWHISGQLLLIATACHCWSAAACIPSLAQQALL